jgi:ABC-type oligopeptide transport system substrate-binding subunit
MTYDTVLAKADALQTEQAKPLYAQLSQLLIKDVAYFPLYQTTVQLYIHSYVQGAGTTTQEDYYWNGISILSH